MVVQFHVFQVNMFIIMSKISKYQNLKLSKIVIAPSVLLSLLEAHDRVALVYLNLEVIYEPKIYLCQL